ILELGPQEAADLVPVLNQDRIALASFEPDAADMDVAAIHQSYVRTFRRYGGTIVTGARVTELTHDGRWNVGTASGDRFEADVVVNAAGAWCDVIGALAGAR